MQSRKYSLFVLLIYFISGTFLANFVAGVVTFILCGFERELSQNLLINPMQYPQYRVVSMVAQGFSSICSFIVVPFIYLRWYEKRKPSKVLFLSTHRLFSLLSLSVLVTLAYLPFVAYIGYWNQNIQLPEFLKSFEEIAQALETQLYDFTLFILDFASFGEFLLGLIVIAAIPALGEEFFFRGLLMTKMEQAWKNRHLAVWVSAFVFSAIHLQFYGLLPRMILGVLFGYLYVWSRFFWMPVLAHFTNNAVGVSLAYFYGKDFENITSQAEESINLAAALFSLLFMLILVLYVKKISGVRVSQILQATPSFPINDWKKVFTTANALHADIVKNTLDSYHIEVIIMNKRDSSYDNFGEREVYVTKAQVLKAIKIIQDEIKFE